MNSLAQQKQWNHSSDVEPRSQSMSARQTNKEWKPQGSVSLCTELNVDPASEMKSFPACWAKKVELWGRKLVPATLPENRGVCLTHRGYTGGIPRVHPSAPPRLFSPRGTTGAGCWQPLRNRSPPKKPHRPRGGAAPRRGGRSRGAALPLQTFPLPSPPGSPSPPSFSRLPDGDGRAAGDRSGGAASRLALARSPRPLPERHLVLLLLPEELPAQVQRGRLR